MSATPRWEPEEDYPYEDIRWQHVSDNASPITVSVEVTASNAYGGPIFLSLDQDGASVGVWLDEETWEAMHAAGVRCAEQRRQLTEDGWT